MAVWLCAQNLSAQKGFSLRVAGGYGWPGFLNNEEVAGPKVDPYTPYDDALVPFANITRANYDSVRSYEAVHGSYGKGINFTLGLGYNINSYLNVEMGVSFLKSATISCKQNYQLLIIPAPGIPPTYVPGYNLEAIMKTNALAVSLNPSLTVKGAKPGWKVYPYARAGITLPVYGGLTHTVDITVADSSGNGPSTGLGNVLKGEPYFLGHHTHVKLKTEGTVSVGFNGAVGIMYQPLPYLSVFAEVNGQYLRTRAKSTEVEEWMADGVDKVEERGKYRTEFVFRDKLTHESNNGAYRPDDGDPTTKNYDPDKPKEDLRPSGPFSYLGFNVGLAFTLSKETLKKKEKKK